MAKITFIYGYNKYVIAAKKKDSIASILDKYIHSLNEDKNDLFFMYKGKIITLLKMSSNTINQNKNMLIFVFKKNSLKNNEINNIVCPTCENLVLINENESKNIIIECQKKHKITYSNMKERIYKWAKL